MRYLIAVALLLVGCTTIPAEDGSIEVYFCPETNCTQLIMGIDKEASCALYDLSYNVQDFLKEKNVELYVDEDNYKKYGTPIIEKGLMHHKFCVYDSKTVTGSFNPTKRGELYNNNNVLVINSKFISENYINEINSLKSDSNKKTPHKKIILNGFLIENYFCPRDQCQKQVLKTLSSANESIHFMVFSFTDDKIGELIIEKSKYIEVRGVMERTQNNKYTEYDKLKNAGVDVKWDSNPYNMHHKVFMVDKKIVITGSYNPTRNGNENNNENVLIIHNEQVAEAYFQEFLKLSLA